MPLWSRVKFSIVYTWVVAFSCKFFLLYVLWCYRLKLNLPSFTSLLEAMKSLLFLTSNISFWVMRSKKFLLSAVFSSSVLMMAEPYLRLKSPWFCFFLSLTVFEKSLCMFESYSLTEGCFTDYRHISLSILTSKLGLPLSKKTVSVKISSHPFIDSEGGKRCSISQEKFLLKPPRSLYFAEFFIIFKFLMTPSGTYFRVGPPGYIYS